MLQLTGPVLHKTIEIPPHGVIRVQRHFQQQGLYPVQHLDHNLVIDETGHPPGAFALHIAPDQFAVVIEHHQCETK